MTHCKVCNYPIKSDEELYAHYRRCHAHLLSSDNFQTIPKSPELRQLYIPDEGKWLITCENYAIVKMEKIS